MYPPSIHHCPPFVVASLAPYKRSQASVDEIAGDSLGRIWGFCHQLRSHCFEHIDAQPIGLGELPCAAFKLVYLLGLGGQLLFELILFLEQRVIVLREALPQVVLGLAELLQLLALVPQRERYGY